MVCVEQARYDELVQSYQAAHDSLWQQQHPHPILQTGSATPAAAPVFASVPAAAAAAGSHQSIYPASGLGKLPTAESKDEIESWAQVRDADALKLLQQLKAFALAFP